jgi:hypothetical protein
MKRIAYLVLAGLALAGCNAAAAGRATTDKAHPGDIIIAAQWATAEIAAKQGDAEMVLHALQTAMSDQVWPQLSPSKQYQVAELYGQAADSMARWGEAHRGFARASELPQATPEDWDQRLHSANSIGDGADAWRAFEHLRGMHLPVLETFGGRELQRLDALAGALANAREARLVLGQELEAEGRDPLQGYNDDSIVWAHYAEALLESGDAAHAKTAAARITDPIVMTELAADRRFDTIVAGNPKLSDPQAAAESYLTWARAQTKAEPRSIAARIAVVRALAMLDRPEEALAFAEQTARDMARGSREDPYFEDAPTEGPFFEGWKDTLLVRLGRGPEAVAALGHSASCHCAEIATIQLAQVLLQTGHAGEARDWLADIQADRLVIEDQLDLAETRVCVAAELGDTSGVDQNLDFLRAHRPARPRALTGALVCANRLEQAGTVLASDLSDPHARLGALRTVQVYADPLHQPYSDRVRSRWVQVLERPEVRRALDGVGRSAAFRLQARDGRA